MGEGKLHTAEASTSAQALVLLMVQATLEGGRQDVNIEWQHCKGNNYLSLIINNFGERLLGVKTVKRKYVDSEVKEPQLW